jgi:hypothetical protein
MEKHKVIENVKQFYTDKIAFTKEMLVSTRQQATDAPGRLVSRYDTSREELGWLADGQATLLADWQHALCSVYSISLEPCKIVKSGCLMQVVRKNDNNEMFFLICPGGAGFDCVVDGKTITLISPSAPLVKAALGKTKGDSFIVNNEVDYLIEEIW